MFSVLYFKWKSDNRMELLESPFAEKLDQNLFVYLSGNNASPASFLAAVTNNLFENSTWI
jgi:hypothetical protein